MAENLLLASLPKTEKDRLAPFLELIEWELFDVLIEPNEPIKHIYFPNDAITSTLQEMSDGSSIETGLMGVEGFVGVQFFLRSRTTPTRTIVQVDGSAYHMRAADFEREVMNKPSPLNELCARSTHGFLVMTSLVAACNRMHTLDERLCRWLKLVHNRVRRTEFSMRHEFLADMLGVHRPTVSTAANILQKAGLIAYSRGRMTVLDSEGLREGACECLELMEKQFDQVFNQPWRELVGQEDREPGNQGGEGNNKGRNSRKR